MSLLRGPDVVTRWHWEPFFRPDEFRCRCACNSIAIETEFMDRLWDLRVAFDRPMVVSSGYRCPSRNQLVSSTGPGGPHTTGSAADIAIFGPDAFDLTRLAFLHGFTGIGIAQRGATRFVHLDTLPPGGLHHPRPRIWSYA